MPTDPSIDDEVDIEIARCIAPEAAQSFFLYAGAGSGKTRSLVSALQHGTKQRGHELSLRGQQIAVITFTNAAANEISTRLAFDPLVTVSTIHSFSWKLIREFQEDIRDWMKSDLSATIADLNSSAGRVGTKKEADRVYLLEKAQDRAATIDRIRQFTYNPAGENVAREAISHSQVISLTADLLTNKPMLGHILATRHPILFIDESQDTNKLLLDAFMHVAAEQEGQFVLGLFGDTMQRIYNDGKTDIHSSIPDSWATPVKVMNHRSPERIVRLSNRIRADVDGCLQESRADRGAGTVRLFIAPTGSDTLNVETQVAAQMAEITGDPDWAVSAEEDSKAARGPSVKRLILEHSMAARRLGFDELFSSLSKLPGDRTSLLDGTMPELQVFLQQVEPLVAAYGRSDAFKVARIVRENSPLIKQGVLEEASRQEGTLRQILTDCQEAVDQLTDLWSDGAIPTLGQVASVLAETSLFPLSSAVRTALLAADAPEGEGNSTAEVDAWQGCLAASFSELNRYGDYVRGATSFATHQGVKGLEFSRVMVVVSDDEARGFMFSYEKLLGAKEISQTDRANFSEGKDSSLDRTRRLMYVTCSRATQALAIVAYTVDPEAVRSFAVGNTWFADEEVVLL